MTPPDTRFGPLLTPALLARLDALAARDPATFHARWREARSPRQCDACDDCGDSRMPRCGLPA